MSDRHFKSFHSFTEHGMKLTGTFAGLLLALHTICHERLCHQGVDSNSRIDPNGAI